MTTPLLLTIKNAALLNKFPRVLIHFTVQDQVIHSQDRVITKSAKLLDNDTNKHGYKYGLLQTLIHLKSLLMALMASGLVTRGLKAAYNSKPEVTCKTR